MTETIPWLARIASGCGARVWLVGGSVRDALLGRHVSDLDLLVEGDPGPLLTSLAGLSGRDPVLFDRKSPPTHRVVVGGRIVDVSACAEGSVEEDLSRRDFTINAMASPLEEGLPPAGTLVDPHDGRSDLAAGRLRLVSPGALDTDPLRMLRGIRFAVTLAGFEPDAAFFEESAPRAKTLLRIPPERIKGELEIIFRTNSSGRGLRLMATAGILFHVMPPLGPLEALSQGRWHQYDALEHTLRVVEETDLVKPTLGPTEAEILTWAAALHDTGKADTVSGAGADTHFHGHEKRSAETARSLMGRLRVSHAVTERVVRLIDNHLRFSSLASQPEVTDRAIRRLVHAMEGDLSLLGLLAVSDRRGAGKPAAGRLSRIEELIEKSLRMRDARGEELIGPRPLLTGGEIMDLLHLAPGPRVGSITRWLVRLQVDGRISRREEAVSLLESLPASRIPPDDGDD